MQGTLVSIPLNPKELTDAEKWKSLEFMKLTK